MEIIIISKNHKYSAINVVQIDKNFIPIMLKILCRFVDFAPSILKKELNVLSGLVLDRKLLHELANGEYANAAVFGQIQKMPVAAHHQIGFGVEGACQDRFVSRIVSD